MPFVRAGSDVDSIPAVPVVGSQGRAIDVLPPDSGELYWAQFPGLQNVVPPLPAFAIGAPSLPPIGAELSQVAALALSQNSSTEAAPDCSEVFIGPVRPPLKPPPFGADLSQLEIEAAHTALRSFILDATTSAGSSPMRISLSDAHWTYGHAQYDTILAWEKAGTLRTDGVVLSDHKRVPCERCKGANLRRSSSPAVSSHRPTDILHTIS